MRAPCSDKMLKMFLNNILLIVSTSFLLLLVRLLLLLVRHLFLIAYCYYHMKTMRMRGPLSQYLLTR